MLKMKVYMSHSRIGTRSRGNPSYKQVLLPMSLQAFGGHDLQNLYEVWAPPGKARSRLKAELFTESFLALR